MVQVSINIQEQDMEVLKPLFQRMGIDYIQNPIVEIEEEEDPEALKLMKTWKNDKVLSVSETKQSLREMGLDV